MALIDNTLFCDGCGVEIPLSPVKLNGRDYCCKDCAQGLICHCGDQMEADEYRNPTLVSASYNSVSTENWL